MFILSTVFFMVHIATLLGLNWTRLEDVVFLFWCIFVATRVPIGQALTKLCLFIGADGWTTDDLKYQWKQDGPVQIVKDLHLPRFTLEKYVSDYCNIKTNTGQS
jgi:hypothetical protein